MPSRRPSQNGWLAYYRELMRTWPRRSSNFHDAEDAAHDAVVGMLRSDTSAVLDGHAYLYRASQNRMAGEIRRQARNQLISLEELAEDHHPLLADPEAAIRASQLADALEESLAQLPLKCRQAYIWHRLEGYSQPEIAERLGVSLNTVERYIMRALRHLREQLQHFGPE
ncbi:RNA polymerase sigma factor [Pollutimonas bauzanensis]|uniref:RNA polymerase sigma-70 factor, ECF subfamily n=1 Tax=Pollutimonas bauzanensis TaxID=658167 RepID=A0A1M5MQ96_9BURK|nr:sigma-70 family RNA polymerase sigma factor [Pollutimonas bauzanensis]SHG79405.1 RNA polymerase sigma-70 factor, ECF subfamily [Pollutimonas bauzanensis]